jgi:hypothetical protein
MIVSPARWYQVVPVQRSPSHHGSQQAAWYDRGQQQHVLLIATHLTCCRTLLLQLEEERKKLVEAINVTFGHLGQVRVAPHPLVLPAGHAQVGFFESCTALTEPLGTVWRLDHRT